MSGLEIAFPKAPAEATGTGAELASTSNILLRREPEAGEAAVIF